MTGVQTCALPICNSIMCPPIVPELANPLAGLNIHIPGGSCPVEIPDNKYYWKSAYPYVGEPANLGAFIKGYSRPSISGTYHQFVISPQDEDSPDGKVGTGVPIQIIVSYRVGYSVEKYENANMVTFNEDYDLSVSSYWGDLPEGIVSLHYSTIGGVKDYVSIGSLDFGGVVWKQNRRTPIIFYGQQNMPLTLELEFSAWIYGALTWINTGKSAQLPSP